MDRPKRALMTTIALHLMQPAARLCGRLVSGLTPWRWRSSHGFRWPWQRDLTMWTEAWDSAENRLKRIENGLRESKTMAARGGDFDRWDLEVRGGVLGASRIFMTIEEHGGGKQLTRLRIRPRPSKFSITLVLVILEMGILSLLDHSRFAAGAWFFIAAAVFARGIYEMGSTLSSALKAVTGFQRKTQKKPAIAEEPVKRRLVMISPARVTPSIEDNDDLDLSSVQSSVST
jgi:hypothetical protein